MAGSGIVRTARKVLLAVAALALLVTVGTILDIGLDLAMRAVWGPPPEWLTGPLTVVILFRTAAWSRRRREREHASAAQPEDAENAR